VDLLDVREGVGKLDDLAGGELGSVSGQLPER